MQKTAWKKKKKQKKKTVFEEQVQSEKNCPLSEILQRG